MPETNNTGYIIAAYVITWVALIAYGMRLLRTTRQAARRYSEKQNESRRLS